MKKPERRSYFSRTYAPAWCMLTGTAIGIPIGLATHAAVIAVLGLLGLIGTVIRFGVARGVFSNEAGLGSAPIAHAASKIDDPVIRLACNVKAALHITALPFCARRGWSIAFC